MATERGQRTLPPPLSHKISPENSTVSLEGRLEFGENDRVGLASFLEIEGLDKLTFDYRLEPISPGRYHLTGRVRARLTQLCVISLEPVPEQIDETLSLECMPQSQVKDRADEVTIGLDRMPDDPIVQIVDGQIDLGALAAEVLASAINPYPRREGSEFAWEASRTPEDEKQESPFAELAKLKPKG